MDYVSKLVEAVALPTNDVNIVVKFLQINIFTRFGTPRVIISDEGTYYCNRQFEALLNKYAVKNCVATTYPQTSGHPISSTKWPNRKFKSRIKKDS